MFKIFSILVFFVILTFGCSQKNEIVYDNYIDSFRHKPENEWDYLYLLENTPQNKNHDVAEK